MRFYLRGGQPSAEVKGRKESQPRVVAMEGVVEAVKGTLGG